MPDRSALKPDTEKPNNLINGLLADLQSPDISIRHSVLSRIEGANLSEEQVTELIRISKTETDAGILFHLQKIIQSARLSTKKTDDVAEIEKLLRNPINNEIQLAIAIESTKRKNATNVLEALRQHSWHNLPEKVLPSVLTFLKNYGSVKDSFQIEQLCKHNAPRILGAAMEALERLNPEYLQKIIVPLLLNPSFGIRSKAVRILHKWDPREALRYFEAMLFSLCDTEKQAALFQAFFFSFTEIELTLLKFLTIEEDENLIKKVGLLFVANPSKSSPARLLEAREASVGKKFELINNILLGVLNSLFSIGIIEQPPNDMLLILESHFTRKRAQLMLERYSLGLRSSNPTSRLKAAVKVCEIMHDGIPEAKKLILEFLQKETNQAVTDRVKLYLKKLFPPSRNEIKSFFKLTPDKRESILTSLTQELFSKLQPELETNFLKLNSKEKYLWISSIGKFGNKKSSFFLQKCLKFDDDDLVALTIDNLRKIDAEALLTFLPQLMKRNSDEIKIAALKVFSLFDKRQALSLVETMINSIKSEQRRQAIFCAGQFDFASISELLLKALKKESDPENTSQIIALLKANANELLFFNLYDCWKEIKNSRAENFKIACTEIGEILVLSGDCSFNHIDKLFAEGQKKFDKEEKLKTQRSNYKLEKIQKIRFEQDNKFKIDASFIRFTIVAYLIGAVLTALIWFLLLAPSKQVKTNIVKRVIKKKKPANVFIIKGKVNSVDKSSKTISVTSLKNKHYIIELGSRFEDVPSVNSEFQGQIRIIKKDTKSIRVELISMF